MTGFVFQGHILKISKIQKKLWSLSLNTFKSPGKNDLLYIFCRNNWHFVFITKKQVNKVR